MASDISENLDESKNISKNTSFLESIGKGFETVFSKAGMIALGIGALAAILPNLDSIKGFMANIWGFISGEGKDGDRELNDGTKIENLDLRERIATLEDLHLKVLDM